MKEISPEELYSLYKETLYKCQSKIFNYYTAIPVRRTSSYKGEG